MAIRKIARLGHPVLRQLARPLTPQEILSEETARLIEDMQETLKDIGGIGLAAPQIHEPLQLAIIEFDDENERYAGMGNQNLLVLINPKITVLDPTEQGFWEGCLSVPQMRGLVFRPRKIRVDYWDINAKPQSLEAEGFLATVFQHEIDHLFGTLYVDRVRHEPGKTTFCFEEEYEKYIGPALAESSGEIGELDD